MQSIDYNEIMPATFKREKLIKGGWTRLNNWCDTTNWVSGAEVNLPFAGFRSKPK